MAIWSCLLHSPPSPGCLSGKPYPNRNVVESLRRSESGSSAVRGVCPFRSERDSQIRASALKHPTHHVFLNAETRRFAELFFIIHLQPFQSREHYSLPSYNLPVSAFIRPDPTQTPSALQVRQMLLHRLPRNPQRLRHLTLGCRPVLRQKSDNPISSFLTTFF